MLQYDPQRYGAACAALLQNEPPELGPGRPDEATREVLQALDVDKLFGGQPIVDQDMARCCLAGLWLRHDFLNESHQISQKVSSSSGSYWHGIMHRREPDFSNAKYWFRRVGDHPVFKPLAKAAVRISAGHDDSASQYLAQLHGWDPFRFVDLCEAAQRGRRDSAPICRRVAEEEWRLLFDYCYRAALGQGVQ